MHGREGKRALLNVKPEGPQATPDTIPNHHYKVPQYNDL
jgi:hypothetical protein